MRHLLTFIYDWHHTLFARTCLCKWTLCAETNYWLSLCFTLTCSTTGVHVVCCNLGQSLLGPYHKHAIQSGDQGLSA